MRFCSIASGSSGNCIYVGSESTHILIDTGIAGKRIEEGLNALGLTSQDIDAVLVTHEHSDHVGGLGIFSRKSGADIYLTSGTNKGMYQKVNLGDMSNSKINIVNYGCDYDIGDLQIHVTEVSHDALEPCAYTVSQNGKRAGVITDLGTYDEEIIRAYSDLDVLLIESNHDERMLRAGRYPYKVQNRILSDRGHLSNTAGGRLLDAVISERIKHVFLGHLSKDNNFPELARQTVITEIDNGPGMLSSKDFPMDIAMRDDISKCIEF